MFSFLKNLFGTNNNENSANENIKKTIDTESLEKEFIQLKKQLSTSNDNNIIEILNKLGEVCTNLNKIDDAISYYEQSLKKQRTLGKASTDLLKLYNIKRKEASLAKDDNLIQFYLEKIDNLMKLNKETMKKSTTY